MITILRCGHDSHHSRPVEMEHRHGLDHYLLLLIKTEGYVEQKGQVLTAFPESAVLFQKIRLSVTAAGWIITMMTGFIFPSLPMRKF